MTSPDHDKQPPIMSSRNAFKDFLAILLAIFLPPLAVLWKSGFGADFFINIALCLLGFIPGLIHALYIIAKVPSGQDTESQPLIH